MKIEIDFKQNSIANEFYKANKNILLESIRESLEGVDEPAHQGVTFRIPTDSRHLNKDFIKALNFNVDNKSNNTTKLSLVNIEK